MWFNYKNSKNTQLSQRCACEEYSTASLRVNIYPAAPETMNFMVQIVYKEMWQCYGGVINIDFLLLFFLNSLKVLGLLLSTI